MNGSGLQWVIGGLLAVLAVALVIAGATGHATQLFQGLTGKTPGSSSTSTSSGPSTSTHANAEALLTALGQNGSASSAGAGAGGTGGGGTAPTQAPSLNPYAGLGALAAEGAGTVV